MRRTKVRAKSKGRVGPWLTGGEVASKVGNRVMKMDLVPYCVESEKSS